MELISSPSSTYLVIKEVYRTHKCRISIGKDNQKSLYILNQIRDRRLIAKYLNAFDDSFGDFIEAFVRNGNYFIVFRYHNGVNLGEVKAAAPLEALDTCEAVCFAALAADLPSDFFCQLIMADCITFCDGEVSFNNFFDFAEDSPDGGCGAGKLAWELSGYIQEAGFDAIQMKTMEKLMKRFEEPFRDLLELYLFIRDFRNAYEPMETVGILKTGWERVRLFIDDVAQRLLFYGAVASALLVSLMLLWSALAPPDESNMLIKQVGGYTLNERGSIDE